MKNINCFVPCNDIEQTQQTISTLQYSESVNKIFLLVNEDNKNITAEGCQTIVVESLYSTFTVKKIASLSDSPYTLIYTKYTPLQLGQYALERFYSIAQSTRASLVYSDYYQLKNDVRTALPLIDYQEGSLRDDFNFGSLLFYNTSYIKGAVAAMSDYQYAGLYDLRLKVSRLAPVVHIEEYLYTEVELDVRKSGEKQFDYVDPKNRNVQIEMEAVCTEHLKKIGAYLKPEFKNISFDSVYFPVEASVIIPVKNRVRTIGDAIQSVLKQKTTFDFNLIIVDNFSTDGTSEIVVGYAEKDKRVIHLIPERNDLGIGGCWNEGVHHSQCGKFSIQLDSDDVYQDESTLQKIVNTFYDQQCAMVIGSYTMTNFNMETIPPGLIDHREWTPDNGRNNALRINGLGAPRAFYTPVLRKIKIPNVSYGEDYAVGLSISREYQIGRVYDSVYLCRRWEDNSDAALDIEKMNRYNHYKDKIRTLELMARKNAPNL